MPVSNKERVAHHRWASHLERTLERAQKLLREIPPKYREKPWTLPIEPDGELYDCLEIFLGSEPEFVRDGEDHYVRFKLTEHSRLIPRNEDERKEYRDESQTYEDDLKR